MLRALRRRLVLLNAIVSGAILLAMAWVSLGIAQQTVTSQYDRDLMRYSASIHAAIREVGDEVSISVQLPADYMVYTETDTQEARLNTADYMNKDDLVSVAMKARRLIGGQINALWYAEPSEDIMNVSGPLVISSSNAGYRVMDEASGVSILDESGETAFITTWLARPVLTEVDGTPYRISATKVSLPTSQELILVMQNRSEEMTAITRLRYIFAACVMGGLALVGAASLFLSSRSIKPVERSIKQQNEFVAAASHELRTPVAAIRANAEVLADASLGEFVPYLESVQQQSEHMTRLVADLIDLARADAGELGMTRDLIDAAEVTDGTIQAMRPLFDNRQIELIYEGQSALMLGDATRLRQILVILLDNALRYTPQGRVYVTIKKSTKHVTLRVADTGIGIPDEEKPRVFDRFYRVDKARSRGEGGAGLGLSIAKQLVGQMGGTVSLSDNEGGGCAFTITFRTSGIFKAHTVSAMKEIISPRQEHGKMT